ncbi:MAG: class I SAM-dependent methyltransferase [Bacteroidales bacterium]|nr:MAG: class I SAM-dependent methyltransferase [Bacteroidales bacterium]
MDFTNCYEDTKRAESYAKLEFPGTYYLAYRDLPAITAKHVKGNTAMDFGCGAGRSTRFLRNQGFKVTGVDISNEMITMANSIDPNGDYRLVEEGSLGHFAGNSFDLVQSIFTFDNIPTEELKVKLFSEFNRILRKGGYMINLVSSPEIYTHDWASFITTCFPDNFTAKCGDKVKTIMKDVEDQRPVEDILWPDEDYKKVYKAAGLELVATYRPLGKKNEPYQWVNETHVAPWVIYVLAKA